MPLILDDLVNQMTAAATSTNAGSKVYTPKFFDKKLTGSGKKSGIINEMTDPSRMPPVLAQNSAMSELLQRRKRTYTNGDTEILFIPMDVIPDDMDDLYDTLRTPDTTFMAKIYTNNYQASSPAQTTNFDTELYMKIEPYSLMLEEKESQLQNGQSGGKIRRLRVCYKLLYVLTDTRSPITDKAVVIHSDSTFANMARHKISHAGTYALWNYSENPSQDILDFLTSVDRNADPQPVKDYIDKYSLYDGICAKAEQWGKDVDVIMDDFFELVQNNKNSVNLNKIAILLRRMEDYAIPLELYIKVYNNMEARFDPDEVISLSKQNMYLLLSNTLDSLNKNKSLIQGLPQQPTMPPVVLANGMTPSPEQAKAIAAPEPLVLVQSGAGTGKSSVIHARMNYMMSTGVNADDITVLSFTNAAANHINELCPAVHSMTIAKMVDQIYHANYTTHILSTAETIINCLDIYFGSDPIAEKLKHKLFDVTKTRANSFINLNNFIEANYDAVINILNQMNQTCLELEIIICYQKIDTFVEPANVQSKYLIIDEVQDNSVFEFVYAIKYVEKHKESLYIVGDCSQTLYEFRASNPKALNVLEASGVFATYQLQINYRSNQEILDFANVMLGRIEANQYAHIQLQANNLTPVTSKSFQNKVWFRYRQVAKISEFNENMDAIYAVEVKPYIDKCMAAGEKVAFLAYTRFDVNRIMGILMHMYPGKSVVSLVSQKGYNSTIFSMFIKKFWDKLTFTPTVSIVPVIRQMVITNLKDLGAHDPQKMMPTTIRMLDGWEAEQGPNIAAWQAAYGKGTMSLDMFMQSVRDSLLNYEIRNNSIRQALLSSKNEEQRSAQMVANADLIVSTIHGAKGLEFQNVVVSMRNKNNMPEDEKRMYYVALTRAMNSEFVLTYDTLVNPKVVMDYEEIVSNLVARENPNATAVAGDDDDEIDVNNASNANIAAARQFLKNQQKARPKAYVKNRGTADNAASDSGNPGNIEVNDDDED